MNTSYILSLLIGAVICTGLFACTLSGRKSAISPAFCALPLGIILGTVCSKVLFVLMKAPEQFDNYGLAAFCAHSLLNSRLSAAASALCCLYAWQPGCASSRFLPRWMPLPLPEH